MYLPGVLFEALDQLRAEQLRKADHVAFHEAFVMLHPYEFAAEFCTLSLDPGRRTGKTSYIRSRADKQHDAIVVGFLQQAEDYRRRGFRNVLTADDVCRAVNNPDFGRGVRFGTVWVDEPYLLNRKVRSYSLHGIFCNYGHIPQFVLLGRK